MRITGRTDIEPERIAEGRGVGSAATRLLAEQVLSRCDRRVPYRTGALRDGAYITEDGGSVVYPARYARYQYRGVITGGARAGEPLKYGGAPMRGAYWDRRMMADEGGAVAAALAELVGGRVK